MFLGKQDGSAAISEKEYDILRRISKRITLDDETGCWQVGGWNDGNGYAKMRVNNQCEMVHRVVYRILFSESLNGREVDHICRTRNCCRPDHLKAVTRRRNMQLMHKRLDRDRRAEV